MKVKVEMWLLLLSPKELELCQDIMQAYNNILCLAIIIQYVLPSAKAAVDYARVKARA